MVILSSFFSLPLRLKKSLADAGEICLNVQITEDKRERKEKHRSSEPAYVPLCQLHLMYTLANRSKGLLVKNSLPFFYFFSFKVLIMEKLATTIILGWRGRELLECCEKKQCRGVETDTGTV